jgi:hypothetical protein
MAAITSKEARRIVLERAAVLIGLDIRIHEYPEWVSSLDEPSRRRVLTQARNFFRNCGKFTATRTPKAAP